MSQDRSPTNGNHSRTEFSNSVTGPRDVASDTLPERRKLAEYAEEVVEETERVMDVCVDYYSKALPSGGEELKSLLDTCRERNVPTDRLVSAVGSVQGKLLAENNPTDDSTVALSRVVAEDIAYISRADGSQADTQVVDRAERVKESTFEIETLATQQAENTDNLADEVDRISSAIEEISATTRSLNDRSDEAQSLAADGTQKADTLSERMEGIDRNATEVHERMESLNEKTEEIDKVVEVINDIAEKTNMLALNASIEAARADGDSEGFAVVAEEVKNLAERSQDQVTEIESLVESTQSEAVSAVEELEDLEEKTEKGLSASREASDTFGEIDRLVTDVSSSVGEVEVATSEQAESSEKLSMMVEEASRKASKVSEEISEIATLSEEQLEDLSS